VFSSAGVAMMGSVGVTTLHPRGLGDPELPRAPKVKPSSLEDSLRTVHRDGDSLCTILMNMALESHSCGEMLRRPRRAAVNSKQPK
jgi:hypothetical protein